MTNASADIKHIRSLDALCGFAAVGVIFVHSAMFSGQSGVIEQAGFFGQRGVQLFYMVSAFALFYSLTERSTGEIHPTLNFFVRRYFRIAPLFYTSILANVFYQHILKEPPILSKVLSKGDILLGVFFLHGIFPATANSVAVGGWSVAVETSFYILVPFLFAQIKTLLSASTWLLASCIACPILAMIGDYFAPGAEWYTFFHWVWFPIQFPVFLLGICTFHLSKLVPQNAKWSALLLVFAAEQFIASLPISITSLYTSSHAFVPLILGLLTHNWKLFVNSFTIFLGKISFSIYLMHFYVLIFVGWLFRRYCSESPLAHGLPSLIISRLHCY